MLGTLYKIRAQFTADTRGAERSAGRLAKETARAADAAERAESRFAGLASTVKRGLAAGALVGLGALVRHVGKLATQSENAQISIASVFSVNKVTSFNRGLVRARSLMHRFNDASRASPGEGRDFLNIFQRVAPAIGKFASDNEITTFAGRSLAAAFAFNGGDVDLTGDQLSQIIQGQGGSDNKTFNALKDSLFSIAGIKGKGSKGTEEFNKLAQARPDLVFGALSLALKQLDNANEAFGKTFTGMFGSLKQTVNDTLKTAFMPLFAEIKKGFEDGLDFIEKNRFKIKEFAEVVGQKMVGAFRMLRDAIGFAKDKMSLFILLATGAAMKRALGAVAASSVGGAGVGVGGIAGRYARGAAAVPGRVGRAAGRGMSRGIGAAAGFGFDFMYGRRFGGPMAKTRGARLRGGIARAAAGVRGAPSALGRAARGAGRVAMMNPGVLLDRARGGVAKKMAARGGIKGLAGAALTRGGMMAGAAIKTVVVGLLKLTAIAAPIVVVIGMIVGAMRVFKDKTNEATQFFHTTWQELKRALDTLAAQFGFSGSSGGGGGFGSMVKRFTDWLGTGVVGIMGVVVKVVERVVTAFSHMVSFFKAMHATVMALFSVNSLSQLRTLDLGTVFSDALAKAQKERNDAFLSLFRKEEKKKKGPMTPADEKKALTKFNKQRQDEEDLRKALAKANKPKIEVKNTITIKTEADAQQVAIALDRMNASSINRALEETQPMMGL